MALKLTGVVIIETFLLEPRLKRNFEQKLDADLQRLTAVFENFIPPYRHASSSSENSDTDSNNDTENLDDEAVLARAGKYRNKIALVNTICICYVGLIIIEEPLMANDLLRYFLTTQLLNFKIFLPNLRFSSPTHPHSSPFALSCFS